jgi:hypothetical protein
MRLPGKNRPWILHYLRQKLQLQAYDLPCQLLRLYCGYNAVTVDISEMKSEDSQARNDTATWLSIALKVLEIEARQTPGIRRSIDIIKRQLSTGRGGENGQHHYQGPIMNNDPPQRLSQPESSKLNLEINRKDCL